MSRRGVSVLLWAASLLLTAYAAVRYTARLALQYQYEAEMDLMLGKRADGRPWRL